MPDETPQEYLYRIRRSTAYPYIRKSTYLFTRIGYLIGLVQFAYWFYQMAQTVVVWVTPKPEEAEIINNFGGYRYWDTTLNFLITITLIVFWIFFVYFVGHLINLACDIADSNLEGNRSKRSEQEPSRNPDKPGS